MNWKTLPPEIKLAVVDLLHAHHTRNLALIDAHTHALCVPALFHTISLASFPDLLSFLAVVPPSYHRHIRALTLSTTGPALLSSPTPRTDSLLSLLSTCTRLRSLSLSLAGSLAPHIIPAFAHLHILSHLEINNAGSERDIPISERLVVSIAATVPALTHLSLRGISRSALHALPSSPYTTLIKNDDDIPPHPTLGSLLSLPSLLRIPSLKVLDIGDTSLDDDAWAHDTYDCNIPTATLHSLALHPYPPASSKSSAKSALRILSSPALSSLQTLVLGVPLVLSPSPLAVPSPTCTTPSSPWSYSGSFPPSPNPSAPACRPRSASNSSTTTPPTPVLPSLSHLLLTPYFPIDALTGTISALRLASASSFPYAPSVLKTEVECYDYDVEDVWDAMEGLGAGVQVVGMEDEVAERAATACFWTRPQRPLATLPHPKLECVAESTPFTAPSSRVGGLTVDVRSAGWAWPTYGSTSSSSSSSSSVSSGSSSLSSGSRWSDAETYVESPGEDSVEGESSKGKGWY